jgi:hypothetical protein
MTITINLLKDKFSTRFVSPHLGGTIYLLPIFRFSRLAQVTAAFSRDPM